MGALVVLMSAGLSGVRGESHQIGMAHAHVDLSGIECGDPVIPPLLDRVTQCGFLFDGDFGPITEVSLDQGCFCRSEFPIRGLVVNIESASGKDLSCHSRRLRSE